MSLKPGHLVAPAPVPRFSKAPYEPSMDAAFGFLTRGRGAEFGMMRVQEILAGYGTLERLRRLPGEASVQFPISWNGLIGDRPHVPKSDVKLKMSRQVH